MQIIFLAHPPFRYHQSMPRFVKMLESGMRQRGHEVHVWFPKPRFFRIPAPKRLKKWLGYVDQYIIFPAEMRRRLKMCPQNALFVFSDQALGPWVPIVHERPHVIHCHDFIAQLSAKGKYKENVTGWSGKQYQKLIHRGYRQGKYFISVSRKTREYLHQFLDSSPQLSEVVYNGLSKLYQPLSAFKARNLLALTLRLSLGAGYILHVGGNQWYKNRRGVIEIYEAWRSIYGHRLPLLLVGERPHRSLMRAYETSPYRNDIHLLSNLDDNSLHCAYSGASVFLFPSIAEGFGWPVAEAMASGCPVISTNEAPMTEVAGTPGFFIPRRPSAEGEIPGWASEAAKVLEHVLSLPFEERESTIRAGIANAKRFDAEVALDKIEGLYEQILRQHELLNGLRTRNHMQSHYSTC